MLILLICRYFLRAFVHCIIKEDLNYVKVRDDFDTGSSRSQVKYDSVRDCKSDDTAQTPYPKPLTYVKKNQLRFKNNLNQSMY